MIYTYKLILKRILKRFNKNEFYSFNGEERDSMLFIAVGTKGVGKTYRTLNELKQYVKDDNSVGRVGKTVLILDANDEFQGVHALAYNVTEDDEFKRVRSIRTLVGKKGIYRIRPLRTDKRPMSSNELKTACFDICNHFSNGTILLEDYNKYIQNKEANDLVSTICTLRHKNIDMWIHLQSVAPISTKLWQNVNYLRFHKVNDKVDRIKHRIPFVLMKLAQLCVNYEYRNNNKRFCCYVDIQLEKILGVSSQTFEKACLEYLSENYQLINKLVNKVDLLNESGKKYKNQKEAVKHYLEDLKEKYFE
tara:strand:+ start:3896 stop:4813 length:918 start_codon:yes stop_codon:yes gene_type:complete